MLTAEGKHDDAVGDRSHLVRIGMAAVAAACFVFGCLRAGLTYSTGRLTPWWLNFASALLLGLLFLWYRAAPARRSTIAVHGTAAIATVALLVPAAYGMGSSKWWLSLVGFSVLLMGRRSEALLWAPATLLLVPLTALLEPYLAIADAGKESSLERAISCGCYVLVLLGVTAAFRRVARRRARELSEAALSLERAARVRSRFLARMSHDLRTPLHGVLSMTDVALRRSSDPEMREPIETAQHSARTLLGLLNNILDVTRAEADAMHLNVTTFSLHETLSELLRGPAAEARNNAIELEATAEQGIVELRRGDRGRFAQIALNLIGNALKFTSAGSVTVRLRTATGDLDRVRLSVSDTGRGIAPEQLSSVFEPFEQASTADSGLQGGVGLGLAIVRELSRLMGGMVHVTSELGRGSTFVVELSLPRASHDGAAGPENLLSPLATPPVETTLVSQRRILVCEDDPVGRRAICALLRQRGHQVVATENGDAALKALSGARFDLLITDVEMPGMNGFELTRRIREQEGARGTARLPIIAATAHAGEDSAQRLYEVGVDAHLPKPFSLERLEDLVRRSTEAPEPAGP